MDTKEQIEKGNDLGKEMWDLLHKTLEPYAKRWEELNQMGSGESYSVDIPKESKHLPFGIIIWRDDGESLRSTEMIASPSVVIKKVFGRILGDIQLRDNAS